MSWNEKTPEEQAAFDRFVKRLDDRHFLIAPFGEKFRGSAINAKHRAQELLQTLEVGQMVHVISENSVVWCQRRTS